MVSEELKVKLKKNSHTKEIANQTVEVEDTTNEDSRR